MIRECQCVKLQTLSGHSDKEHPQSEEAGIQTTAEWGVGRGDTERRGVKKVNKKKSYYNLMGRVHR